MQHYNQGYILYLYLLLLLFHAITRGMLGKVSPFVDC